MALKDPKSGASPQLPGRRSAAEDAAEFFAYIRENPIVAAAAAGFIVLVIAVGILFVVSRKAEVMESNTDLAIALVNEDPALRAEALRTVAETRAHNEALSRYLAGETAIRAQKYPEARALFEQLLAEHPTSEYAARAEEALAFLLENEGDREAALEAYRQVIQKYPDSFTAKTLYRRIGQIHEKLDRPEEAIDAYMQQFRVFPDGRVTVDAMNAIRNLRDNEGTVAAEAADAAFRTLSEESPRFGEVFPFYFVEPEEPADALAAGDEQGLLPNTEAISVAPQEAEEEAPAEVETPAEVEAPAEAEAPAAQDEVAAPKEEAAPETIE
jgi:tetratricopeptide (TPR) repeat protein